MITQILPTQGVLAHAWSLYKTHWSHLATIGLIVYAVVGLISLVLSALGWFGAVLAGVASLIGAFWVQGALVKAVEDIRDGQVDLTVRSTFAQVGSRLGSIAGASILAAIAITIGFVLLIVPGLYLMTIWSVLIPVIVLENRGVLGSFGRSRELVRGYGMNVFGLIALTFLIMVAASVVLAVVFGVVFGVVFYASGEAVAQVASEVVSGAVLTPYVVLVWTLLYHRLRAAKEGARPSALTGELAVEERVERDIAADRLG